MHYSGRKIIHIDMDAFFAAVEQRDFPELQNKAVIVGGLPNSRSVVATCSYEARKYGVHSAMPCSQAQRLCPHAIFVKPRYQVYRETSAIIQEIFSEFSNYVEPVSLDEAYLDVSSRKDYHGSATLIAQAIKEKIYQSTHLYASAGISYNKFFAKIASDMDKPNGLMTIKPENAATFIESLSINQFHGVGQATEKKMITLGIKNGKDLKSQSKETLIKHFGKKGLYYYNVARGIDNRPVVCQRKNKSVGVENTFDHDIYGKNQVMHILLGLFDEALTKLNSKGLIAYTLTIKIKYNDFVQITRSKKLSNAIKHSPEIKNLLDNMLRDTDIEQRKIRLLGITLSSLDKNNTNTRIQQLDLFTP